MSKKKMALGAACILGPAHPKVARPVRHPGLIAFTCAPTAIDKKAENGELPAECQPMQTRLLVLLTLRASAGPSPDDCLLCVLLSELGRRKEKRARLLQLF
jgi:hypothetical protein